MSRSTSQVSEGPPSAGVERSNVLEFPTSRTATRRLARRRRRRGVRGFQAETSITPARGSVSLVRHTGIGERPTEREGGDVSTRRGMKGFRSKHARDDGAALVEFAVLAPLLILLVLGIVEFGYLFAQYNEIRHAARETGRYAAVSNPDRDGGGVGDSDVIDAACDALNLPGGATFDLDVTAEDPSGTALSGAGVGAGNTGIVTITAFVPSLSNVPLVSDLLPDQLSNTAFFRIEQPTLWSPPINQVGLTC